MDPKQVIVDESTTIIDKEFHIRLKHTLQHSHIKNNQCKVTKGTIALSWSQGAADANDIPSMRNNINLKEAALFLATEAKNLICLRRVEKKTKHIKIGNKTYCR